MRESRVDEWRRGAAPSVDESGTVEEQELRARANRLIDSSNKLIDELFRVESMIGCILQSGQVLIGWRRLWLQRDGQRGPTFDGK